jgi:predicted enzyme related to lactoylglutathione lyase
MVSGTSSGIQKEISMPRTVHFEIQASQPQTLINFYSTLFGWTFKQWGENEYWLIDTGTGKPGIDGGLLPRRGPPPAEPQAVNAFVCTIDVEQLDQAMEKAAGLGATVAMPKMPVEGIGMLGYFKDPDGNLFGMMQFNKDVVMEKP